MASETKSVFWHEMWDDEFRAAKRAFVLPLLLFGEPGPTAAGQSQDTTDTNTGLNSPLTDSASCPSLFRACGEEEGLTRGLWEGNCGHQRGALRSGGQ